MRHHSAFKAGLLGVTFAVLPARASAQYAQFLQTDTALIRQALPEGFDRGRNVAVTERPRPDFDALGIPLASFNVFPRLDISGGGTSNVFLTDNASKSDGFALIDPTVRVVSDWSRNKLQLNGGADVERYFSNSRRNQASWNLGANGELELGDSITIQPEADVARLYESPYSGDTRSDDAVISNYLTSFLALRGQYEAGQIRTQIAVDRTSLDFSKIDEGGGLHLSQDYRNRNITRLSGQAEYAFTPSVSVYAQLNYDHTSYDTLLFNGDPNRTSNAVRAIVGVNFDLAGFLRGSVGAGYVKRNYKNPLYKSVDGPSVEARLEYFPSELTTVTLRLRRFLEDSSIGSNDAYFDNRVSLRVDHEVLTNLLVNATGEYGHVSYIGLPQKRDNYRISAGARYMATRRYGLSGLMSYGRQTANGNDAGSQFKEARGQIGLYLQI